VKIAEGDRSGVRLFPPLIVAAALGVAFLMRWRFPAYIIPAELVRPLRITGALFLLAWLALAVWAVVTLRRLGTTANPAGGSTALALGGPYRFSRNPMYLSLLLLMVGVGLVANTLWPLLMVPILVVVLRRKVIDHEERYLTAKFGEPYRALTARVRRWI
jgi:protein-S-isoprenylcysteine O-methyltransferase Ste14